MKEYGDEIKFACYVDSHSSVTELLEWMRFTDSVNVLRNASYWLIKDRPTKHNDKKIEIIIREIE